jgi:hypothetical protein
VSTTTKPLTEHCTDHSTEKEFGFSFACDLCGKEWRSVTVPYERAGFSNVACAEAEQRIWADEHRVAFEQANLEAVFHFNYCRDCGRWVCDECFLVAEDGRGDVCADCASKG